MGFSDVWIIVKNLPEMFCILITLFPEDWTVVSAAKVAIWLDK